MLTLNRRKFSGHLKEISDGGMSVRLDTKDIMIGDAGKISSPTAGQNIAVEVIGKTSVLANLKLV